VKIRGLIAWFLSRPEEVKRRAEVYVESQRSRLSRAKRELDGWERRLADTERRRSALIDLAADGTITRNDLRTKLAELDKERETCHEEIRGLRQNREELEALETLPELAEQYRRDLPLLAQLAAIRLRNYESIGAGRTPENPLGIYKLMPDAIRYLPDKEMQRREREAEEQRATRYQAMYEDLGLRAVAHPDGTLEASWRFREAVLRNGSDTSKNKHATKHFHSTGHPIIRSFEPGEDWRWCYVDEIPV
jgi:chromosome segregation ATPase